MIPAAAFLQALRDRPHALVMGVLNVTPDSFSDGGRFEGPNGPGDAIAAGRAMAAAGAAILDVGGESTRPGATASDPAAELARVLPVVQGLRDLPVSIDTRHTVVAQRALEAGAVLVNDVSGGADTGMLDTVAEAGAGIVLMHMRGDPGSMQETPRYADVVGEIEGYLLARARAAEDAGVNRERILLDPGIGFGKTHEHNLALLRSLPRLGGHGYPLLLGVSRKSFLGLVTGRGVSDRRDATTAAVTLSAAAGAAVVRVHDVDAAMDAVKVAAAMQPRDRNS